MTRSDAGRSNALATDCCKQEFAARAAVARDVDVSGAVEAAQVLLVAGDGAGMGSAEIARTVCWLHSAGFYGDGATVLADGGRRLQADGRPIGFARVLA